MVDLYIYKGNLPVFLDLAKAVLSQIKISMLKASESSGESSSDPPPKH